MPYGEYIIQKTWLKASTNFPAVGVSHLGVDPSAPVESLDDEALDDN